MPTKSLPQDPHIIVSAYGLFISHVKDGSSQAEIGLLRNAPDHNMAISVKKNGVLLGPSIDYTKNFSLIVDPVTQPGIETYQLSDFSRAQDIGSEKDFQWVVDIDREILNGGLLFHGAAAQPPQPAGAAPAPITNANELAPIITFNKGVFFTEEKSKVKTLLKAGATEQPFGCIANVMGIAIQIPEGSTAIFKNGKNEIFRTKSSSVDRYEINIDRDCLPLSPSIFCQSDFKLIYSAIQHGPQVANQINLVPIPPPPIDPATGLPIDPATGLATGPATGPGVPCMGGNTTQP